MIKKIIYILILFNFLINCTTKKVVKYHGVPNLLKKQELLILNKTNKNDIIKILGTPSTKSKFNNDVWIYIDQNQVQPKISNYGKMVISRNDILVLEIDKYGILKKKTTHNKDSMNEMRISENQTGKVFKQNSFIYKFFSSLRQKINDPLNKRVEKRREISQR